MTCDPVAGYVQVPCIERCAFGAVKAWIAFMIATNEIASRHRVDLDTTIKTLAETGKDMSTKYKETSEGGLAANLVLAENREGHESATRQKEATCVGRSWPPDVLGRRVRVTSRLRSLAHKRQRLVGAPGELRPRRGVQRPGKATDPGRPSGWQLHSCAGGPVFRCQCDGPDNTQISNSDGTLFFATGSLAPGVTV